MGLAGLLCLLILAACGDKAAEPTTQPATQVAASGDTGSPAAGADVASGCWTAEQRVEGQPYQQWSAPPAMTIDPAKRYTATMVTSEGAIELELLPGEAPQTVNNFVCLARAGYYDGTVFHRVVPGFVIQGGDPTATGTGDPGYEFADEPVTRPYETGSLAMANSGANTNGSQFFVVIEGGASRLQPLYNHYGRVTAGQDVAEAIGGMDTESTEERVTIERVTIHEG